MGFDVYALKPKTNNENHFYFRANVWYWRPLWSLVEELCSDQMTELQQKAGHYNDGVAIEDNMSILIGNQLKEALGERPIVVARELTKLYEEIIRGNFSSAIEFFEAKKIKGEIVIMIGKNDDRINF